MDGSEPKRYGRGLFLATVAGGLTSLAWGKPVWSRVSAALSPAEGLIPFVPDERLAHLHGVRLDAELRPGDVAARTSAASSSRSSCSRYRELLALPRVTQVSDFHCVTGWTVKNVHWTGVRITDIFAKVQADARGERRCSSCRRRSRISTT